MSLFNLFKKKKKDTEKDKNKLNVTNAPAEAKAAAPAQKPEAAPPAEPKAIKKLAQKVEAKAETKTDAKASPKTAPKTEKKPDQKSEKKAVTKATPVTSPKVEVKSEATAVQKAPPKTDAVVENIIAPADPKGYTGRFEINKSKDGKKYFFNLYASNKVGIATSQMYSSAQSALIGIKSVIANAAEAPIEDQSLKKYDTLPYPKWEIYIDNGGKYRFRLNASNGSCVCHSQGYTTKTACKNGIDSIIRSSRNAEIDKTYLTTK